MISPGQAQLLRFAVVGTGVAALYVLMYLGFLGLGLVQTMANALAFLLAVIVQYVGQTRWTFRRPLVLPDQIVRFVCTIGLGFLLSAGTTGVVGPMMYWHDAVSAAVVAVVLPVLNYLIFRVWVFAEASYQQ